MNLEVIYPTSVNVVPYGQALLVFHGTMEYNEEGVAIGENQGIIPLHYQVNTWATRKGLKFNPRADERTTGHDYIPVK